MGLGTWLLAWGIFTLYMTVVATRINGVLLAVFTVLSLTFVLLTAGALGGNANIGQIGGYAGLVTAALAWYGSMAGVANNTWKKAKLPTFPFSA